MPNSCIMFKKTTFLILLLRFSTHRKEWELAQLEAVMQMTAVTYS